jgi:hypothetical protein
VSCSKIPPNILVRESRGRPTNFNRFAFIDAFGSSDLTICRFGPG